MRPAICLGLILFAAFFPGLARAQDSDGDSMPDVHEIAHACLMPYTDDAATDNDTDGLTNLAEYTYSPNLNPCDEDTDGDGVKDGFEVEHGSDPISAAITPRLVKTAETPLKENFTQLTWTGSEYVGLIDDIRDKPDCESNRITCMCDLYFQRLDRFGQPVSSPRLILKNTHQLSPGIWTGNEFWISSYPDGAIFTRLTGKGDRVAPDLNADVKIYRAIWNGSQVFSMYLDYDDPALIIDLFLLGAGGVSLDAAELPYLTGLNSWPRSAWTGSEYGIVLSDYNGISFARISSSLDVISHSYVSDLSPHIALPVWTGSEYWLSFSIGYHEPSGTFCNGWYDYCQHVSVLLRLNAEGQPIEQRLLPAPGSVDMGGWMSMNWLSGDTQYLGWVTPDLTPDSDGACDETDCLANFWLHWMTPEGDEIGPAVLMGQKSAFGGITDKPFTYFAYSSHFMPSDKAFISFSPDSDGDGVPDEFECGIDSAEDWDSDGDGSADGLEDTDGDGLTNADEAVTHHTEACNLDTDSDGISDGREVAQRTNPLKKATSGGGGGGGGGGGCALAPAGAGVAETGAGLWPILPLLLVLALRRARRRW